MATNHLIIGLGGTGGKILREFRKRVYEEFHNNDPQNGVFLEYVYVDSSPADLNDRSGWKVLGKSVHLGEAQKVNINGINASMLQQLGMYPGLQSFINPSDKQLFDQHMGPLVSAGIGGQRRRLGRLLTANNISDKSSRHSLTNVLHSAVTTLQARSGINDVTFHICAGLAGGTGSGSIVDVISQIRKKWPYHEATKAFKIRLFLYVPERNMVHADHDSGFYQANGYAALQELNAISTGYYAPTDVSGERDVFTQEVQRLLGPQVESFEAAYVYSNVNEKGRNIDLSKELPSSVADFLFQTIVAASGPGRMSRLVGCENDGAAPEMDQSGEKNRSRKFLSFGITRIEYPESEIDEYVSYNFAIQATLQMTYNLWQDGIGYGACALEDVGSGFADEIKNKKNRERFKLSNAYLTLGKPIIETDNNKKWKDVAGTWETRSQQQAALVQQQYAKKEWLAEFTKLIDDYYDNSFRAHGVKKFYEIQRQELKAYARHIRRHIEAILFDEWTSGGKGSKSILEIEKYALLLRSDCSDRIATFKQQISNMESELEEYILQIKDVTHVWNNIGWLKDAVTNASTKTFSAYRLAKCNYYTTLTRMEAYQYGIVLLQEIMVEMGNMIEGIQAFKGRLCSVFDVVTKQAGTKCQANSQRGDSIIRKFNPETVHQTARQYATNLELQSNNAAEIRNRIVNSLGEEGVHTFANLYSSVDYDTIADIIVDICSKNAHAAMEDTAKHDPMMRMLGVNILDKLKNELNTDEKLEAFVVDAVDKASTYIQFNPEEKTKSIGGGGAMMTFIQVAMPEAENDSQKAFRAKLLEAFKNHVPGFNSALGDGDVSINFKPNQMVVVCANAGFPLRFIDNLTTLKEKYDQLIASPQQELNKMVLHTESFARPLPPLFERTIDENRKDAQRALLLAFAMNLVQMQQNTLTGERFFAINNPNELGDNWIRLAKDFVGAVETLAQDFKLLTLMQRLVTEELGRQARSNDQKAVLRKALGQVVQLHILQTLCEGNQYDPRVNKYRTIALDIFGNELKEL